MNFIIESIFKNLTPDRDGLLRFGFKEEDGVFFYSAPFLEDFILEVSVVGEDVDARVKEADAGDEYTLFLVQEACGGFVGEVRAAYESALIKIAESCFNRKISGATEKSVLDYVKNAYSSELEYLWRDDNAVWRRKDTGKWFGAVLVVAADKFLRRGDKIKVLDLRAEPEYIDRAVDGVNFFRGYHMNKKHWITVVLDGSVSESEIFKMIDKSYILADK